MNDKDGSQIILSNKNFNEEEEEVDMFSNEYHLGVNITILLLELLSTCGNGLIIFLFLRSKSLRANVTIRLIFILSASDFIFAIADLPHIVYFISKWNPIHLDYDPYITIITHLPLTMQMKIHLILTLSIVLDRFQAIRFPFFFMRKEPTLNILITLSVGFFWGTIDMILECVLTRFVPHPGCAAAGCFISKGFKKYWSHSNIFLCSIEVILILLFVHELKTAQHRTDSMGKTDRRKKYEERQRFQANRLSLGILLNNLIFLLLPSASIGILTIFGVDIFEKLGPISSFCLIFAGFTNSIVYLTMHAGFTNEFKRLLHSSLKAELENSDSATEK